VCEPAALYRSRRPERTSFYALLEAHFDQYERVHAERFEPRHGPLRRVVRRAVEGYLDCGRYLGGFARLRCASCRSEHLVAFSCQTRNFCPSCQAKRAALFAEFLSQVVLLPVPHRHVVFTVPKALRALFERERRLLGILARSAFDATRGWMRQALGIDRALPGMVSSIQTFGSFGNWHPHIHALVSTGLVERGGGFHPLGHFDAKAVEARFRRLVLGRLKHAERLSASFHETLLSWTHSGFSVHAGEPVSSEQPEALERLARYVTRAPVGLAKVFPQPDGRVKLLTPPDPKTGRAGRLFDAIDPVHAITTQIPDPRQHMVRYQGAYANRVRKLYRAEVGEKDGAGENKEGAQATHEDDELACVQQRRRSWARLLRRIYEVDPMVCPRCGDELKIVAVITDPVVVDRILAHRRQKKIRSPFEPRAPPAA